MQERVLNREVAVGVDHSERLQRIKEQQASTEARLAELRERWDKERDLVTRIREVRSKLEANGAPVAVTESGGNGNGASGGTATIAAPAAVGD